MSTHNICFYGEISKIIPSLSQNTLCICSTACDKYSFSHFSYILALQHLEDETRKVEELRQAELRTLNSLVEKTKSAVIKRSALKK